MIKIIINDVDWEIIRGQREASYIFPESLEIPKSRINDLEYISILLEEEVESDGKGECEVFVKSIEYEVAELEEKKK